MENVSEPGVYVIAAERVRDGIIITFDDGKTAFYSATLLRSTLPQAKELKESDFDE